MHFWNHFIDCEHIWVVGLKVKVKVNLKGTGRPCTERVVDLQYFNDIFCRNDYLTYISDILVVHSTGTRKCLKYFVNDSLYISRNSVIVVIFL